MHNHLIRAGGIALQDARAQVAVRAIHRSDFPNLPK